MYPLFVTFIEADPSDGVPEPLTARTFGFSRKVYIRAPFFARSDTVSPVHVIDDIESKCGCVDWCRGSSGEGG
jgi:hypothetical protein